MYMYMYIVTLEDEECLGKREGHIQKDDDDVIVAETVQRLVGIFDVLHQLETVLDHAGSAESCT